MNTLPYRPAEPGILLTPPPAASAAERTAQIAQTGAFPEASFESIFEWIVAGVYRALPLTLTEVVLDEILKLNIHNRPWVENLWKKYAKLMTDDLWEVRNGDTVTFSTECRLIDGQHRIRAAREAGKPLQVLVVFGATPEAFATKDQGRFRRDADILAMAGESCTAALAAALKVVSRLEAGQDRYDKDSRIPSPLLKSTLDRHPGLRDSVAFVNAPSLRPYASPAVLAAVHYWLNRSDPKNAESFFEKIRTGAGLDEDSPVLHLRNRMVTMKGQRKDQEEILALWIKSFNMFKSGRKIKSLVWRASNETFPKLS